MKGRAPQQMVRVVDKAVMARAVVARVEEAMLMATAETGTEAEVAADLVMRATVGGAMAAGALAVVALVGVVKAAETRAVRRVGLAEYTVEAKVGRWSNAARPYYPCSCYRPGSTSERLSCGGHSILHIHWDGAPRLKDGSSRADSTGTLDQEVSVQ